MASDLFEPSSAVYKAVAPDYKATGGGWMANARHLSVAENICDHGVLREQEVPKDLNGFHAARALSRPSRSCRFAAIAFRLDDRRLRN